MAQRKTVEQELRNPAGSDFGGRGDLPLSEDAAFRRKMFADIDEGVQAPIQGSLGNPSTSQ